MEILPGPEAGAGSEDIALKRTRPGNRGGICRVGSAPFHSPAGAPGGDIEVDEFQGQLAVKAPQENVVEQKRIQLRIGIAPGEAQVAAVPEIGLGPAGIAVDRLHRAFFLVGKIQPGAEGKLLGAAGQVQPAAGIVIGLQPVEEFFRAGFGKGVAVNRKLSADRSRSLALHCIEMPFLFGDQPSALVV